MDHPRSGLRYVDADDLDNSTLDFDGLDVQSRTGDKLGEVDGFIIDIDAARPYYVVVDAGGWFTSKYFLLPVGHASLDVAGKRLIADVPRDRVSRYPGFDRSEFDKLTDADLDRMDRQMMGACCPDEAAASTIANEPYGSRAHYRTPSWWDSSYYRADRVDRQSMASAGSAAMPSRDEVRADRDRVAARAEHVVARSDDDSSIGDVSPHFAGRAQPGDVLGLETGGEETHVGDTSEDENKQRRDAEEKTRKDRP
jgi:hypothetical protein